MDLENMNLEQVIKRLADLDEEVRAMTTPEAIDEATEQKKSLLVRKAELEDLEQRKQTALDIQSGKITPTIIDVRKETKPMEFENMTRDQIAASEDYRSAWLKTLQRQALTEVEKRSIAATNVAGAIPTATYEKIFAKMVQTAPLLNEITLLRVPGNVNFAVESTVNAAAIHTENGEVTPVTDTFVTVSLAGYEIVKIVRISATVNAMTIGAFEDWLTGMLAESIGRAIENMLVNGTGTGEGKGVAQANTWSDTTNGVDWGAALPTYAEIVELMGYLKGGYHRNAKFLMAHSTFFSSIMSIKDDSKYPIAVNDNGTWRILGYPVLLSDYVAAGDIYFGDFSKLVGNLSSDVAVSASAESGFVYNAIDYRGAAIFDCDIALAEAFVKGEASLSNS